MKISSIITTIVMFVSASSSFVQRVSAQEDPASLALETSGFVDFYYSRNLAQPATQVNKFRNFDIAENQFTLSLAEIVLQKKAQPAGFRIDADFGTANDLVQTGVTSTLANLQQAYVTVIAPIGEGLSVDVGKFVTHMGYEVIESKDNWNYSRSLLFAWTIPYFHTGIRLAYPIFNELTITAHILNGWNSVQDNNGSKTLGLTVNYTPLQASMVILNWIGGVEQPRGSDVGKRHVLDLVISRQFGEYVLAGLNADYGRERLISGFVKWRGIALYARYRIDENSALALRGEILDDPEGYATGSAPDQRLKEVTITYEHKFVSSFLFRLEARHDWSNIAVFDKRATINSAQHQDTILFGTIITF